MRAMRAKVFCCTHRWVMFLFIWTEARNLRARSDPGSAPRFPGYVALCVEFTKLIPACAG